MSCKTCTSSDSGTAAGCKNNGGCQTGGCNKLNVFDWLSGMDVPSKERFNIIEVRFKGGRKEFFENKSRMEIVTGDPVVVDVPNGHHLGFVSMQGELVRLQMMKKGVKTDEIRQLYRKASDHDLEKYEQVKNKEQSTLYKAREIIQKQKLEMKLTDVEFQADSSKATFYYSADDRVDFRELIKLLAAEFRVRVEMRQISLRQEAGRLGGLGSCGRELCCSTWLSDFKTVSTSAARYQNLSLNPTKLSGQCGRLKCCLNYELDTYKEALKDIPKVEKPLKTQTGEAVLQKTDIFRKLMWFGYENDNNWYPVDTMRVMEIIRLNEAGEVPEGLAEITDEAKLELTTDSISDLDRFDKKYRGSKSKKKGKNKKKKRKGRNRGGQNRSFDN